MNLTLIILNLKHVQIMFKGFNVEMGFVCHQLMTSMASLRITLSLALQLMLQLALPILHMAKKPCKK